MCNIGPMGYIMCIAYEQRWQKEACGGDLLVMISQMSMSVQTHIK